MTDADTPGLALVRMPVAPVQAEPRVSSAQTTQTLFGRAVLVLGAEGDWLHVRTLPDGYDGWLHAGYCTRIADEIATAWAGFLAAPPEVRRAATASVSRTLYEGQRVALGCTARVGGRTLRLPLGAWLPDDAELLDGEAAARGELAVRCPPDGDAVVRSARRYFGSTSYQWGGVTPWGADCSGLVQSVFALHGVELPRDASPQAAVGRDAGADLAAHAPGDLLFFSDRDDRRVTHVGIAAGGGAMVHLALGRGGWADEDLARDDDPYVVALRARFVAARRVL